MDLITLLRGAVEKQASDIFVLASLPLSYKLNGIIVAQEEEKVTPQISRAIIEEIYETAGRPMDRLLKTGDDDFSLAISGLSRFRVSTYKQRGSLAAVIRLVSFEIPNYEELGIPESVMSVADKTKGLVLVTGPAGGGKSTTLACIIDRINATRNGHIITLEEPLEYLHKNKKSVISQREIETDTENYVTALRACLRQSHLIGWVMCEHYIGSVLKRSAVWKALKCLSAHDYNLSCSHLAEKLLVHRYPNEQLVVFSNCPVIVNCCY